MNKRAKYFEIVLRVHFFKSSCLHCISNRIYTSFHYGLSLTELFAVTLYLVLLNITTALRLYP